MGGVSDIHAQAILLDDVPNSISVRRDRPEPEQSQRGVSAIAGTEDRCPERLPTWVGENGRHFVADAARRTGDVVR